MTSPINQPIIVGRSSSHFTRVARIFAVELGVDHAFQVVRDLSSVVPAEYGDNPALKVPSLRTSEGVWFGALSSCRELWRRSDRSRRVIWPEQLEQPLLANTQELVTQAMATEVGLIMGNAVGATEVSVAHAKMRQSLVNSMAWLEQNALRAISELPSQRDLSFLEVTLFCLVTHLDFRGVLSTSDYSNLSEFRAEFARRPSAEQTAFRFDT